MFKPWLYFRFYYGLIIVLLWLCYRLYYYVFIIGFIMALL